jgi:hypothetical protein
MSETELSHALPATPERHEIEALIDSAERLSRSIVSNLGVLRSEIAKLELPEALERDCPRCGLKTKGPRSLAEHLYQLHDGPEPEHWQTL